MGHLRGFVASHCMAASKRHSGTRLMGAAMGLFLLVFGAILRFGIVSHHVVYQGGWGLDLHAIGDIAMVIGAAGIVLALVHSVLWSRRVSDVLEEGQPVRGLRRW